VRGALFSISKQKNTFLINKRKLNYIRLYIDLYIPPLLKENKRMNICIEIYKNLKKIQGVFFEKV